MDLILPALFTVLAVVLAIIVIVRSVVIASTLSYSFHLEPTHTSGRRHAQRCCRSSKPTPSS
jgi:hypothetical protein